MPRIAPKHPNYMANLQDSTDLFMAGEPDYSTWHLVPQAPSSYSIHITCQIENLGWLLEQLPKPFGIFDPNYRGYFVEVGAYDGIHYSNIMPWAKNWNGIMVEPMPENVALLQAAHKDKPWLHVEPVACGEKEGNIPMFFEREGSRLATTGQSAFMVPLVTLDSLLEKHKVESGFDLLVIDTEDYERLVLYGFTLTRWLPLLCIVETHEWQRLYIHRYFREHYRIYSEDHLNTLFVRRDWSPGDDNPCPCVPKEDVVIQT